MLSDLSFPPVLASCGGGTGRTRKEETMTEFYEQLSSKSAGQNPLISLRLSDAVNLLDASVMPIEVRRAIANSIETQLHDLTK